MPCRGLALPSVRGFQPPRWSAEGALQSAASSSRRAGSRRRRTQADARFASRSRLQRHPRIKPDRQRTTPLQRRVIQTPVLLLVLRGGPTARDSLLPPWFQTVKPSRYLCNAALGPCSQCHPFPAIHAPQCTTRQCRAYKRPAITTRIGIIAWVLRFLRRATTPAPLKLHACASLSRA